MRNSYHKWGQQELEYLVNNHITLTDSEIARSLSNMLSVDITTAMVRRQRKKLAIRKPRGRRQKGMPVIQPNSGY